MDQQFEHLGKWIRYWRKQFGYTQPELGDAVGVSKQHISNLERRQQHGTSGAESNASIELLDKLSRLFDRPVKEARILAGYEKPNHIATVEEALDSALFFNTKGLSEADKQTLRPLLEVVDREVKRLSQATPQDDDIRQSPADFDRETGGRTVKRISGERQEGGLMSDHLRSSKQTRKPKDT